VTFGEHVGALNKAGRWGTFNLPQYCRAGVSHRRLSGRWVSRRITNMYS